MNYISYCLFDTKNIHQRAHRDWDIHRMEQDRYWYNIPASYIINSVLYPDFKIKLYISENFTSHPLFPLLQFLDKQDNFILKVVKANYNNTEPTMWRMIPLWDDETENLLCRDIDSLPTINEIKATKEFLSSDYLIHTMRTHRNHNAYPTKILAGLCGFKKDVVNHIPIKNFIDYYKHSNGGWGVDQNTLIKIFYTDIQDKKGLFLDSPIKTETHDVRMNNECGFIDFTKNDYSHELLTFIDSFTEWAGEPIDFRKNNLQQLLNFEYKECELLKEFLEKTEEIKNFYL
jgi:hypothetical protein